MKRVQIIVALSFICVCGISQIRLDKVVERQQKKTERKIENRVEKKIDKGVDKALDKTEEGIEESVKGDDKEKTSEKSSSSRNNTSTKQSNTPQVSEKNVPKAEQHTKPQLSWNKYDFVPGTEIIFEDILENEKSGEFPSKWDLFEGTIENASLDGQNVIYFLHCNTNGGGGIVPLIKNSTEDYLPEEFTIEFDAYFSQPNISYYIFLADYKNQKKIALKEKLIGEYIRFDQNSVNGHSFQTNYYPGTTISTKSKPGWRYFALSFNNRALKIYLDDSRIINLPNYNFNPLGVMIGVHIPTSGEKKGYLRNVKIAKGAVPLYDKVLTDGKFVTTGIKFDVNKATIKPESMGTINYVIKMLTDHPELMFSVEGHTDADGDDVSNQKLSEARAKAVMDKLTEHGIAQNRLTFKGWGESKPVAGNDAPEGKAQNRRVEFVKM